MPEPVVYVDVSTVEPTRKAELESALAELAAVVEREEPRILSYQAFLDPGGNRMTVVHVHPDAASLATHLDVAGRLFPRFRGLVRLERIDFFGQVPEAILKRLGEKTRLLGGTVWQHCRLAGFVRLAPARG